MAWRGSISRSIASTARSVRTSPSSSPASLRPSPPLSAPRLPRRAPSFSSPSRPLGALGCVQSLMPMQGAAIPRLTSHLSAAVRACCELSQGTFRRTCPDR
ncbi:hypothetical protein LUZ61_014645 [Rhynchospora tenuis]|uniref:Uncharacterized protein n=1 Tax=Rhynchospora tenuis TaxID=198213 RepID=A0AAD5WB47_9POAL|nr:hypothetical protein LUZ61_014645 [Rhynchospora tenuis]